MFGKRNPVASIADTRDADKTRPALRKDASCAIVTTETMNHFTYVRARDITEALALLNQHGVRSRILAGGTDLLLLLREDPNLCDLVVDISQITLLHRIEQTGGQVSIGAAATFSELIESAIIAETAPLLVQACQQIGAVQIRNIGTLGGNVANAAACADSLPVLVCLGAVAHGVSPEGRFMQPVADLVVGPNRTLIPQGGLLIKLSYEVPAPASRSIFLKLGRRNAMAISRLTVAALGRTDAEGRIAEVRLVPGSATPVVQRFHETEHGLIGRKPDAGMFLAAAEQAAAEMIRYAGRRWSSDFKERALKAMVARALSHVFNGGATL
jgi:CO/xanthine dehydrogenase FAD-binding subunit